MSDEILDQQDANVEESSEPQIEESQDQTYEPSNESNEEAQEESNTPFHEHPRFKELVEERNSFKDQSKAYERQLQEFQARMQEMEQRLTPKEEPQVNPVINKLREIDPEFASYIEQLESKAARVEALDQWRQEQERGNVYNQAMTQLKELHTKHEVPEDRQQRYQDLIVAAAQQDPNIKLTDLPKLYEQIHKAESEYLESVRRAERAKYVQDKKADVSKPSPQPKGKPVSTSNKFEFSKDPEEARMQAIQRITQMTKKEKEI